MIYNHNVLNNIKERNSKSRILYSKLYFNLRITTVEMKNDATIVKFVNVSGLMISKK